MTRPRRPVRVPLLRGWNLWPVSLVRGAGFPVSAVAPLASASIAAVARSVVSGEAPAEALGAAFEQERPRLRALIRALAREPRLREAITWQNRGAVEHGLDSLVRAPADRDDAKLRKKEAMVVSYLQRYATKCDTIGFFGPLGWARWDGQGQLEQTPGPTLLLDRAVFFEPWAIAAVIDGAAGDDESLAVAPLRRLGHVRVAGLAGDVARLAKALDGTVTARRLSTRLRRPLPEVLAMVRELIAGGIADVALPAPISHRPEAAMRAAAKRVAEPLRSRLMTSLDELEGARHEIESAAGQPEALRRALGKADETFTRLSGRVAKRHEGRTYAGRSIVYEETRRATELRLGESLRQTLEAPLTVLLELARLFTARIARELDRGAERAFTKLGGGRVPLVELWRATAGLFEVDPPPAVKRAVQWLQGRVTRALGPVDPGARELRWSSATLERAVRREAARALPGWPGARHHAPDVMLAKRGERLVPVLGELHAGVTPFTTLSVLSLTPWRAELEALFREDLPGPHVSPVPWEDFARSTHDWRLAAGSTRWHVDLGFRFTSPLPPSRVRAAAELLVRRGAGGLEVVGPGFRMPLAAVFERRIKLRAANEFHPIGWTAHRPRIWLDEVVIAREAWRLERAQLDPWALDDGPSRFLAVTRLATTLGWPRWVFVKSPLETKPVFVDLSSPALVELLCKQAREAPSLVVTEMLPTPDECWLEDAEGHRFVAELRLLAVDPFARPSKSGRRRA
ncbi:MAG: lantibiotic dehydratase [Myxococcaceae bacterium]|nr:lantibiotic dehydratase [Myxococcaceae bacterium]